MGLTLAIDFGSTYTKVVAFDLSKEELVCVVQAASTVDTDMTISLLKALEKLKVQLGIDKLETERIIASSSAAGGLRVVATGLVSDLTSKAAEEAALGAGAKLIGTYSYGLCLQDIQEIEQMKPDMILLTGGTDGGNKECILNNAALLAKSKLSIPFIIAGNKVAAQEAKELLERGGKYGIIVDNVLPELNELNVEPTRAAMRDTFMKRIIHGKGMDKARSFVGEIIMPTPSAVLQGVNLLAQGCEGEKGLGELIAVDVGGATTDVDSIASGHSNSEAVVKGLPEPYMKRTVEGDLGIRYNAETILEKAGRENLEKRIAALDSSLPARINLPAIVKHLAFHIDTVPECEDDFRIDIGLSCAAVDMAMARHCGRIEDVYFPSGKVRLQYGKDLTRVKSVIGTGGIFAYGKESRRILEAGCFDISRPESLRPINPDYFVDERYILYAIGLLEKIAPLSALRIMKKHLKKV